MLPSSVLSLIIPTWPFRRGSHRSAREVGARPSAWTASGAYPIPVNPDCQVTVYLLPGSYAGSLTSRLAFAVKFGKSDKSSGISQLLAISSDNCGPFVSTIRSQPVSLPCWRNGLILAKNSALSLMTGR